MVRVKNISLVSLSVVLLLAVGVFAGPVTQYGRLYASGNKIVGANSSGAAVQLKGPSMQWSVSGWGSDRFFIQETVDALIDGWSAQIIRAPLGIDFDKSNHSVSGGYLSKPDENWARVKTVVDATIARDVYAIIDWHSHNAHEQSVAESAVNFFTDTNLAGFYGNNPAVIFEIYNEPEDDVMWAEVKAYSNKVIKAIRDKGFKNLILIGSPVWDWQLDIAANDPPSDPENNMAFVCHFYAATHKINDTFWKDRTKTFRAIVKGALDANKPVFVSEWGTNDATETGKPNLAEADKWHAFLDSNKISSCAWGVTASDYNELDYWTRIGSPLYYDKSVLANWTNPGMMTAHGRYVYKLLTGKDTTYSSTTPELPPFTGPKIPIQLSSNMSSYTNDGGEASLSVSGGIAHLTYTLGQGNYEYTPYVGAGLGIGWLSNCEYGIGYTYKGSAHVIRAEQSDVSDYAYHENLVPSPNATEWTEVAVPWGYFYQPEWTETPVRQDVSKITEISWYRMAPAGTTGELWVKDAYCLGCDDPSVSPVKPNGGRISNKTAASFIKMQGRALQVRLAKNGRVDIFNMKGSKVRTVKLAQGSHTINLNNLPHSTYLIKAKSGFWSSTIKTVVK